MSAPSPSTPGHNTTDQSNEAPAMHTREPVHESDLYADDQDDQDAILRTVAFPRYELARTAITLNSRRDHLVGRYLVKSFSSTVVHSVGILEALPMSRSSAALLQLDIQSYWNLRQVNRRARQVASDIHRYRVVAHVAKDALRAMLRSGMATHVRVVDLYDALASSGCRFCDDNIGDFLFLPQVSRCCFTCLRTSPRLDMVNLDAVNCGRTQKMARKLFRRLFPVLRTLPGKYSLEKASRVARSHLAPISLAMGPLTATLGMRRADIDRIGDPLGRYAASIRFPFFDMVTSYVQYGVYCKGCYVAPRNWAYATQAMRDRSTRVYSERGFIRHFWTCSRAIRLWEYSKKGKRTIGRPLLNSLPFIVGKE